MPRPTPMHTQMHTIPDNAPQPQRPVDDSSYASGPSAEDQKKLQKTMAWKHVGIAGFAQFMDSSDAFFIIRRFGHLNARVMLMMQDRIARKEAELLDIDAATRYSPSDRARNNSFRWDIGSKREILLDELKNLLKEYNEFVSTYSALKARRSASPDQIHNVQAWLNSYPNAIRKDDPTIPGNQNEQEFIEKSGDLIPVVQKDRSPMRWLLQQSPWLLRRSIFRATPRNVRTNDPSTHLISESGFEWFTSGLTILIGLLLLFGPIWWLHFVSSDIVRLSVITGFVTVFTILCTLATFPRPFEVLAASAAYSAVLLVYLQISHQRA